LAADGIPRGCKRGRANVNGLAEAVEPDFEQQWPYHKQKPGDAVVSFSSTTEYCAFEDQNADGGKATGSGLAWNFANDFSQLAAARKSQGAAKHASHA